MHELINCNSLCRSVAESPNEPSRAQSRVLTVGTRGIFADKHLIEFMP